MRKLSCHDKICRLNHGKCMDTFCKFEQVMRKLSCHDKICRFEPIREICGYGLQNWAGDTYELFVTRYALKPREMCGYVVQIWAGDIIMIYELFLTRYVAWAKGNVWIRFANLSRWYNYDIWTIPHKICRLNHRKCVAMFLQNWGGDIIWWIDWLIDCFKSSKP